MTIDWSKAPEGATHYYINDHGQLCSWWKVSEIKSGPPAFVYSPIDGEWVALTHIPGDILPMSDSSKTWTGEGLPPVGTVCEYLAEVSNGRSMTNWVEIWLPCTIIGPYRSGCAVDCDKYGLKYADTFRPIRTAEQIAAEERKKEILEMIDVFATDTAIWGLDSVREICGFLYDAGYRKQETQ